MIWTVEEGYQSAAEQVPMAIVRRHCAKMHLHVARLRQNDRSFSIEAAGII
jgi:hypothetical protein